MSIPVIYWPDGALQGNIPVNDSLQALAALGQASAESTANTPPTTTLADVGKMWLVGTAPTGAWAARANSLALCTAAGIWRFFAPGTNAWLVWDKGVGKLKRWDGTAWIPFTADETPIVFGQEYLFAFHQKLIAGTAASMLFSGDSTTEGTGIVNTSYLLHNAVLRAGRARRHVLTATNGGHSGANTETWRTTWLAGDLAANPDLMVLRWGLNDPFAGRTLAQFETSLRAGLTTLRASKTVAQMSVVLMVPNAANDPPNGRTPAWIESTRAVIRKAARDFQCVFIDTFKLWEDTVNAAGNWMDNPFGDGRPLHPREAMNGWIASKLSDLLFPTALDQVKSSVSATMTADATFPTGAFSTVVYNNEIEDARGEYNPATGIFTCQQAGAYLISAFAYFEANTENRSVLVSIAVNGAEAVRLCEVPYYGTVMNTGGMAGNTTRITLAAGDQVRIQSWVFSAGANYKIKNYAYTTYLRINRLD